MFTDAVSSVSPPVEFPFLPVAAAVPSESPASLNTEKPTMLTEKSRLMIAGESPGVSDNEAAGLKGSSLSKKQVFVTPVAPPPPSEQSNQVMKVS